MEIEVVSSEAALRALFHDWRNLQLRAGRQLFTDPAFFNAWWDVYGRSSGRALHIVAGRRQGRLVALAPLVIMQRYGLRILEWGGANVLDYSDTILDRDEDGIDLWRVIRKSRTYDLAFIRSVHADCSCRAALAEFGRQARSKSLYYFRNTWSSADAWFEELAPKKRKRLRQMERRLGDREQISFNVHTVGRAPQAVMDALIDQKTSWAVQNARSGLFDDPSSAAALLTRLADAAGELGSLHLSWLARGKQIIATHLGFIHRNVLYYYMPSYDIAWARFSPGSLLLAKLLAWCNDAKLSGLDFMQGDDPYKAVFANSRVTVDDFSFARSTRGWAAEVAARALYQRKSSAPHRAAGARPVNATLLRRSLEPRSPAWAPPTQGSAPARSAFPEERRSSSSPRSSV